MDDYSDIVSALARDRDAQKKAAEQARVASEKQRFEQNMRVLGPIQTALDQIMAKWEAEPSSCCRPKIFKRTQYASDGELYQVYANDIYSAFNGSLTIRVVDQNHIVLTTLAHNSSVILEELVFRRADDALPVVLSILADQMRHR